VVPIRIPEEEGLMSELGKYRRLSKDYEALPETSVESIGAPSLPILFS
jgi:hypothetical protein